MDLHWHEKSSPEKTSDSKGSDYWFGISMLLLGFVVGYLTFLLL
jgi:hypothetical protein